ncbi:MAG: diguanylate cyclase domain-containing protein [Sphingorhabdus sp.]
MGSQRITTGAATQLARLWQWFAPPAPQSIREPLRAAQIENISAQAPMLLGVATINICIIMAVCWNRELPLASYSWMAGLVIYCLVRIGAWRRMLNRAIPIERTPRIIKANIVMALAMMLGLSATTSITFALGTFERELMIPVSVTFGAMAIAHCFCTLRPAAIGVLVGGITPIAGSLILLGDFNAIMMGLSMLSVEILMIRFVASQYDRLISQLFLEQQIRELANSDPLTGLPNRRAIMAAIEKEIARYEKTQVGFGIALLDLDGFKEVNDSLGHHAGDLMLLGVGARLSDTVLPGDSVARLGGDEFIILFRDIDEKSELSSRATAMLAALCQPIELDGHRLPVAASLGYALFPQDGTSVREVMHSADFALYAQKRVGKIRNKDGAVLRRSA